MNCTEMLGVARLLIENARLYGDHLASTESGPYVVGAFNETIKEFIERFYELAAPQLPMWVIDRLLCVDDEDTNLDDMLDAMDNELAGWQRGGIVTSQIEPLREFTEWLYEQHTLETLEDVDDQAVRRTLRRNTIRVAQVLKNNQA